MSERRDANENNQNQRLESSRGAKDQSSEMKGQTREQRDEQESTKTPASLNN